MYQETEAFAVENIFSNPSTSLHQPVANNVSYIEHSRYYNVLQT